MAEPAPLQPDLPFDLESPKPSDKPVSPPARTREDSAGGEFEGPSSTESSRPAWRPAVVEDLPPPLGRQVLQRLRDLPWAGFRAAGVRVIRSSGGAAATLARYGRVAAAGGAAGLARVAPYAATLARNTARAGLVQRGLRLSATAVHVVGFPGAVLRAAIQFSVVHRSGLTVESVTYFEIQDPAGYVVYEAPHDLGTGLAVAYVPTGILLFLALLCLAPALTPRAILHLPPSILTWLQIWVGLAFAAHALPSHEEAVPLAEQARVGVGKAEPLALVAIIPAQLIAWATRFGATVPALLGILLAVWLSGLIFR